MSVKDHPLIVVIVACSAVAAGTWKVSQNIVVNPLEKKIVSQKEIISDLKINPTQNGIIDNATAPNRANTLKADSGVIRLGNGRGHHNYLFSSTVVSPKVLKIDLEIENVVSDSCIINTTESLQCDQRIEISHGIYTASGSLRLDKERGVIRYSGKLLLINVAESLHRDNAVLAAY